MFFSAADAPLAFLISVARFINRQYGWLCVWLLCRLYCGNAIVSLNCSTAFVPKCGRRNAEVQVTSMGFVTHRPGLS